MAKLYPIKWTGSKTSSVDQILKMIPNNIENYYEPFCGSFRIGYSLMSIDKINECFYLSDANIHLINLWNRIINNSDEIIQSYENHYLNFKNQGKSYYFETREQFNKDKKPEDFLFIIRNSCNGLIRFNSKGNFNASVGYGRNGCLPETLRKSIAEFDENFKRNKTFLKCCSYKEINPKENDYLYLDPPYSGHEKAYGQDFKFDDFWEWVKNLKCKFEISLGKKI